jgi:hypothetical protein
MSEANTRKICYEELFDKFKNAASTWLKDIPEARGLCLVVDWKVGRTEFPPSLLITLDPPTEQSLIDSMSQTLKTLQMFTEVFNKQINQGNSVLKQADALIKSSKAKPTE